MNVKIAINYKSIDGRERYMCRTELTFGEDKGIEWLLGRLQAEGLSKRMADGAFSSEILTTGPLEADMDYIVRNYRAHNYLNLVRTRFGKVPTKTSKLLDE